MAYVLVNIKRRSGNNVSKKTQFLSFDTAYYRRIFESSWTPL